MPAMPAARDVRCAKCNTRTSVAVAYVVDNADGEIWRVAVNVCPRPACLAERGAVQRVVPVGGVPKP
jgi:hypothetical protein